LQHPTSHPTIRSTQDTTINAQRNNLLPLLAGKYGKSTKHPTCQRDQANKGKSSVEAERVRVLGALRSLQSKMKLAAEKRQATDFLCHKEREK
jgi:hypothetical protein